MRMLAERVRGFLRSFWAGLRQWSGDAAYERYVECAGEGALSREKFYVEELERKYSRPNRCC